MRRIYTLYYHNLIILTVLSCFYYFQVQTEQTKTKIRANIYIFKSHITQEWIIFVFIFSVVLKLF